MLHLSLRADWATDGLSKQTSQGAHVSVQAQGIHASWTMNVSDEDNCKTKNIKTATKCPWKEQLHWKAKNQTEAN